MKSQYQWGLLELNRYPLQMHSILRRLFGYAKHKARTVASSGLVRVAWLRTYLRAGGTSVQLPCATSAAMPMLSPSVGCGVQGTRRLPSCRAVTEGGQDQRVRLTTRQLARKWGRGSQAVARSCPWPLGRRARTPPGVLARRARAHASLI